MPVSSTAIAHWTGGLNDGAGAVALASRPDLSLAVDWRGRSVGGAKTTPEELIAAAHAACFSMAFSNALEESGAKPRSLTVRARVKFQPGKGITTSALEVKGEVARVTEAEFARIAEEAKQGCPVSQALAGVAISLRGVELVEVKI